MRQNFGFNTDFDIINRNIVCDICTGTSVIKIKPNSECK